MGDGDTDERPRLSLEETRIRAQEYARAYFRLYPSVLSGDPEWDALRADLSPLSGLLFELVVTDWSIRAADLARPLALISERLRHGPPPSNELRAALDMVKSAPEDFAQSLLNQAGDLKFEAFAALFWSGVAEDRRAELEMGLSQALGDDFARSVASRLRVPVDEIRAVLVPAAWEEIETSALRRDRWTKSQRGLLRKSVAHRVAARLSDLPSHDADPERVAREFSKTDPVETPETALELARSESDLIHQMRERGLSDRESALLLQLALEGEPSVAEAGRKLGMSPSTARVTLRNARKKFGVA